MNKLLILLLLMFTVSASEDIVELCELIHHRTSLVDSHSDGIPDTDTSENSEDDTELDSNYTVLTLMANEQYYKLDNYNRSFIKLFLEIPNPPPE